MKIIVSHPTGNANLRAVLQAFHEAGILSYFYTCLAINPQAAWLKVLPQAFRQEMLRRSFPLPEAKIRSFPLREMSRLIAQRAGLKELVRHEEGLFSVDRIYQSLDAKLAGLLEKNKASAVYAYEDGALKTFAAAKHSGMKCFYDLPIGYWRAGRDILQKQMDIYPDWADTLTGLRDSKEKLERKDGELALADKIFVASSFTASTLKGSVQEGVDIEVIPYGFPKVVEGREYQSNRKGPLKLLFVGGLSQRKGIAEMFEAVGAFGNRVELTVVGRKPTEKCKPLNENLARHLYIPGLPHSEILELMRKSDVLLFPSHFEGFGLVVTEAMSQGTPVITTENTCGPDLIEHGHNGWIFKAGDKVALKDQIEILIENRDLVVEVGKASMAKAKSRPWAVYGSELTNSILNFR